MSVMNVLYDLAQDQAGYFTTRQARDQGVSYAMLSHHVRRGDLERHAHGVYRLHRFPPHRSEDVIATLLWAGHDAAASDETALSVYDLAEVSPPYITITIPRHFRGVREGVRIRQAPLPDRDVWTWNHVRVTTPERTLLDAAKTLAPTVGREAAEEAIQRGLTTRRRLSAYLRRTTDSPDTLAIFTGLITDARASSGEPSHAIPADRSALQP